MLKVSEHPLIIFLPSCLPFTLSLDAL
jgi:hypothetical protein